MSHALAVKMFTSWQVRCGIAAYAAELVAALRTLPQTAVDVVPYDRQPHPRADYAAWGMAMNAGDVAHVQHEYSFFGYLNPWGNHYGAFITQIERPLVITRHVTFDGPLTVPGRGVSHAIRRAKWAAYNRWLGPYATYLNQGVFAYADRIIVLSARLKEHLVARGLAGEAIHVIPAGVPRVRPPTGGAAVRARWGWQNKRVLGIFGYITAAKGHRLAVAALAQLPPDVVLLVAGGVRRAGDQGARDALEHDIAAAGLQDRVQITGFLEDAEVPAHMAACDLLLYPATHADSSYSLVTGLAYGCAPVIASDVYGHREVAARGAGITLFVSGSGTALAAVVLELLDAPERRAAVLAEAARYAEATTWEAVAAQTRQVYLLAQADWQKKRLERGRR